MPGLKRRCPVSARINRVENDDEELRPRPAFGRRRGEVADVVKILPLL
jgi:hypothetical protein